MSQAVFAPTLPEMTSPSLPDGVEVTRDVFLGGRVEILQPRRGYHRSGSDAVFLAACLSEDATGRVVDLGAGSGAAGFCVAARVAGVTVTLVERDPVSLHLARAGLELPANAAFAPRVEVIAADVTARENARIANGLARESFDHAIMNPPYWENGEVRVTPAPARADAHVFGDAGLDAWVRTANSLLRPGGSLSIVFRADRLKALLDVVAGRFGAATIFPLHPRPRAAAHRVLLRAVKGSRAAPRLLPGLVLHPAEGSDWSPEAEAINRGLGGLAVDG